MTARVFRPWHGGKPTSAEAMRFYVCFGDRWVQWYRFVRFVCQ